MARQTNIGPSIVYFSQRNILRNNCQNRWLYIPPSSGFCRYHPIVNHLFRVVAVINQTTISSINQPEMNMFRLLFIRSDDFPLSIVREIYHSYRNDHKREIMEQYITNSLLTLQLNNPIRPPSNQNVRFIFSNELGLFVAWFPSVMENLLNNSMNCAVMIPIKNKPYMRLCSQRYNFVSFIELNDTIFAVLPNNRLIKLNHDYIIKQYRVLNNLDIDLDQFETINLFQEFFNCSRPPPIMKLSTIDLTKFNLI